jgi:ABC-type polysaccharide/polyol phosphate export permease
VRRYRYLFEQLVRREFRQKYQGSVVGVLWYLINPLVLMALYGVMLGPLLKAVHQPDYPVFILSGLLAWLFFSQGLTSACTSLVEQQSLVTKIRFPRETIPAASVTVQLVPLLTMIAVLLPVGIALRDTGQPALALLPVLVVSLFAFTLGAALIAATLHAYYRDVQPILTAALMPWFFVSGVLFRLQTLPGLHSHHWIEPILRWVNPVAPFVAAFQRVLYDGQVPDGATLAYVIAAGVIGLGAGLMVFRGMESELAVIL